MIPYLFKKQNGFTIVELTVVVVAIGVLAALAIVGYNGVQDRAREVSIKSDLENASGQLQRDYQKTGNYPVALTDSNDGGGLASSPNTVYTYLLKGNTYCLSATSSKGNVNSFYVRGDDTKIKSGVCQLDVTTFAGTGVAGFANGTVTTAQFGLPYGIVEDSLGNIYVADQGYSTIRKIDTDGNVTNFAGTYSTGFVNGTGAAARFNQPKGLAIDSANNIYVADCSNNSIRKISPGGVVSTFAGSGTAGAADGTGVAAQFTCPTGITVDQSNIVYVTSGHTIRKITPAGVVTTFAGSGTAGSANGTGVAAQFNNPVDLAINGSGDMYVVESSANRIRKISPTAVVTNYAGSGSNGFNDGVLLGARFDQPAGIAIDKSGTIYVADTNNRRIRKVLPSGVTTYAGNGTGGRVDGPAASAQFSGPNSVYVTQKGTLLISDSINRVIRKIQ